MDNNQITSEITTTTSAPEAPPTTPSSALNPVEITAPEPVTRRVYLRGKKKGEPKRVLVLHKGQLYQASFTAKIGEVGDECEVLIDPEHGVALARFEGRELDVLTPVDN